MKQAWLESATLEEKSTEYSANKTTTDTQMNGRREAVQTFELTLEPLVFSVENGASTLS